MLGCPDGYQVQLHWRGGKRVYAQVEGVSQLRWGRRLDDTSEAEVTVQKRDAGGLCCGRLGGVYPWTHEVSVYRDGVLVWQGPLLRVVESRNEFRLSAQDVTGWLHARAAQQLNVDPGVDIAGIAAELVREAIDLDGGDFGENVLDFMVVADTGIVSSWNVESRSKTAFEALRDLTELGVDFTAVGRSIVIGPEADAGTAAQARLTDVDFATDLEVEVNGSRAATSVWAVGRDGVEEHAGGWTYTWDRLERIVENTDVEERDALQAMASTFLRQNRPPLVLVRVPDRSQLAPTARPSIRQLVCGQRFDVALEGYCHRVVQGMRLSQLQVDWDRRQGEQVQVSTVPLRGDELQPEQPVKGVT